LRERDMEAFVVAARWRYGLLTDIGKMSYWMRLKGEYGHLGIRFKNVDRASLKRLEPYWREDSDFDPTVTDVSFDFMSSLKVKFQKYSGLYYSSAEVLHVYKIGQEVSVEELFENCLLIAETNPVNRWFYRLDALFVCCPCRAWCLCAPCDVDTEGVAPSTCAAIVLRAIAASLEDGKGSLDSDVVAMRALGMKRQAWSRYFLTAHTPLSAIEHLLDTGLVKLYREGKIPPVFLTMLRY